MSALTGLVVVNYGSHALVERNFGQLDLRALGAELVVVDNFRSAEASRAMAAAVRRHGWRLLAHDDNPGFGAGVNAGARLLLDEGADVLVVANPDLALPAAALAGLAAAVRADPKTVLSPRILRPDGRLWFGGGHLDLDAARTRSVPGPGTERTPPWISGACFAVHRELWQTVGGFDDDYFLYWEDVDLSYRLARAGARLEVRDDLVAVHDVGGTQHGAEQRAKSAAYYYWNCRNRLLFAAKNLDRADRSRWLRGTPADVRRVLLRGGRRQLAAPGRTVWPALRGAASGAATLGRRP